MGNGQSSLGNRSLDTRNSQSSASNLPYTCSDPSRRSTHFYVGNNSTNHQAWYNQHCVGPSDVASSISRGSSLNLSVGGSNPTVDSGSRMVYGYDVQSFLSSYQRYVPPALPQHTLPSLPKFVLPNLPLSSPLNLVESFFKGDDEEDYKDFRSILNEKELQFLDGLIELDPIERMDLINKKFKFSFGYRNKNSIEKAKYKLAAKEENARAMDIVLEESSAWQLILEQKDKYLKQLSQAKRELRERWVKEFNSIPINEYWARRDIDMQNDSFFRKLSMQETSAKVAILSSAFDHNKFCNNLRLHFRSKSEAYASEAKDHYFAEKSKAISRDEYWDRRDIYFQNDNFYHKLLIDKAFVKAEMAVQKVSSSKSRITSKQEVSIQSTGSTLATIQPVSTALSNSNEQTTYRQINNLRLLEQLELFSDGLDYFRSQGQAINSWTNNDEAPHRLIGSTLATTQAVSTSLSSPNEQITHRQANNLRLLEQLELFSRGLDHFTSQEQASNSWSNHDFDLESMTYNAQSKMILNLYQQHKVGTRVMGAMQAGVGIGQLGLSAALAETGVGVAPACLLAIRGADNLVAGGMTFIARQDTPTILHQAVRGAGFSDTTASWVEFGVDLSPAVPSVMKIGILKLYDLRASRGCARNNSNNLQLTPFTPAFNQVQSFSVQSVFDGALYPKDKLMKLVDYLGKRNVHVHGTNGRSKFVGMWDGSSQIYWPENPTVLEVKHELSHLLDFKKFGLKEYMKLSTHERERLVLERLQNNRIWSELNDLEKKSSIAYVEKFKEIEIRNAANTTRYSHE